MSDSISVMSGDVERVRESSEFVLSKVPEVTFGFWVIKIVATTLGEVGGNAVSMTMKLGYLVGSIVFGVPLILAVVAQIKAKKFHPSLYWATITLTTLAGTTLADFFDRSLGIGYLGGSLCLISLVLISLGVWRWSLGSVDIETVVEPKAEAFYWTTIMFSQTLGTALGDWMADSTPLGYNGSALLIGLILAGLASLYYFKRVSNTFLFWAAFILTRPLDATLANSLDKPVSMGGLAISDISASVGFLLLMIMCLALIPQRPGRH
ncbi:MAG: hypothetical protein KF865_03120 [Bdellovibrionaceae bacterium]|nr:hypothetical protein [Pseudobdellovibrionaceae bacterium]